MFEQEEEENHEENRGKVDFLFDLNFIYNSIVLQYLKMSDNDDGLPLRAKFSIACFTKSKTSSRLGCLVVQFPPRLTNDRAETSFARRLPPKVCFSKIHTKNIIALILVKKCLWWSCSSGVGYMNASRFANMLSRCMCQRLYKGDPK